MFNLRAVGEKIRASIINLYDYSLNKIAIHSKAYKELQKQIKNENDFGQAYNHFNNYVVHSPMLKITAHLYKEFSIQMQSKFDQIAVRQTTVNDWIIVQDELEKSRVELEMAQFSGAGQVYTINEFLSMTYLPRRPEAIYITSSVYIKDYTQIVNLLYMHNLERTVL